VRGTVGSMDDRPRRPPALVVSCAFGVVGAVLLLAGVATGNEPILIGSGLAAALSLVAALVWRSQLIDAWHRQAGGRNRVQARSRRR
jgi:hypothetical protein